MANKKSEELVQQILTASTRQDAIAVLERTLEQLHLTSNYITLVDLKDRLDKFSLQFREISDSYRDLVFPRSYDDLHTVRVDLNFLYRDTSDDLSFEVNKLYLFYRERKTVTRAEAIINLKNNEEFQKEFKTRSTSAIRDYMGYDNTYNEWTSCNAVAYGLYKQLEALLNSIRQMTDLVSSEEKRALMIAQKDVK